MNKLTRKEREAIFIQKSAKLQRIWGNRIEEGDYEFVEGMTDEELDNAIKDTKGQIQFEWKYALFSIIFVTIAVWFLFGR